MNVGIYMGRIDAEEGGGHTFRNMIVDALSRLQAESPDDFFLLYEGTQKPPFSIPGLSLQPEVGTRVKNKLVRMATGASTENNVLRIIRKYQIDLVWFPSYHFVPVEVPYLYTVWDVQHRLQPIFPEVSAAHEWDRRETGFQKALKKASFVLVGTERGIEEISFFYQMPRERIRKLPHPTPPLHFTAALPIGHLLSQESREKYIFYPAQFWAHKNHIRIIEAVHHLKTKHNAMLHAVFAGSDKGTLNYLRNQTRLLGLEDQIHFIGFVSNGELVGLYKNAFVLCYATLFGPENLPPLEAFSLGCPAIVSDIPGAREQYGSAALFFDPLSSEDLAARILDLMNDPVLKDQLLAKGFHRAKSYTPDHYVKDIFEILNDVRSVRKTWAGE